MAVLDTGRSSDYGVNGSVNPLQFLDPGHSSDYGVYGSDTPLPGNHWPALPCERYGLIHSQLNYAGATPQVSYTLLQEQQQSCGKN